MYRFALFTTMAAVILAATASADAAPRKKPQVGADRSAAVTAKHKRGYVSRPAAGPWNQPWQANQQWPTSINDGSFSYSGGRDFR